MEPTSTTADLWKSNPDFMAEKSFAQVIAMSGDGKLGDGSVCSSQVRELLSFVPRDWLSRYVDDCLAKFDDSGLALQDVVNELGRRLGFTVTPGRYRGKKGVPGFDGLWETTDGRTLVVEVKTTDAYNVKLETIAAYREQLEEQEKLSLPKSAVLIIVGRQDTGALEAQIRGSRHAWDMRLISTDALLRLLGLKEGLEDPALVAKIHAALFPQEFTKLDGIIDLVFDTAEEIIGADEPDETGNESGAEPKTRGPSSNFHEECIKRVETAKDVNLVRESRSIFKTPDDSFTVVCLVSKYHDPEKRYWYSIFQNHVDKLSAAESSYFAFGCRDARQTFLIPSGIILDRLKEFSLSKPKDVRPRWQIYIYPESWVIKTTPDFDNIPVSEYKL
jgi:hypothetical protein